MTEDGRRFEAEVQRVARLLWPTDPGGGAVIYAGKERDGIYVSDDCVHAVECTVSRSKQKAVDDGRKLAALTKSLRKSHRDRAVRGWFVTHHEPTADQRAVIQGLKAEISAVSYDVFRSKLINAKLYLSCRQEYAFGSATDPQIAESNNRSNYIRLDPCDTSGQLWPLKQIAEDLIAGARFTLLGDYGAGKSTTCRELFFRLRRAYLKATTICFPILLSLRDHHGQRDPAEALERHARNVGYANPHHLVRAWRAGFVTLLLDGFDELGSPGWTGIPRKLRDLRYQSMVLVRSLVEQSPPSAGVLVSGRQHYFDSEHERRGALASEQCTELTLNDFTDEQVADYLKKLGWVVSVPSWLPTRPLLIGYLASRNILQQAICSTPDIDPASGWDQLLSRICEREARMDIGVSGETVRDLMEGLASRARRYVGGLGPLQPSCIADVFRTICGEPDERALILLQRLPGLAVASAEDGSRLFIDADLADVARAGDVVAYIRSPYDYDRETYEAWQCTMGPLGRQVAANKVVSAGFTAKQISATATRALLDTSNHSLSADILQVLLEAGLDYVGAPIAIEAVEFDSFFIDSSAVDLSGLTLRDCAFQVIEIDSQIDGTRAPKFESCIVGSVRGRVAQTDLPGGVFDEACEFASFTDEMATTQGILETTLPLPLKVGLSILKKLYLQAGSGRKHSALNRGLDQRARVHVQNVLDLLRHEGLIVRNSAARETVWLPVKEHGPRVRRLLAAPSSADDSLADALSRLDSDRQ